MGNAGALLVLELVLLCSWAGWVHSLESGVCPSVGEADPEAREGSLEGRGLGDSGTSVSSLVGSTYRLLGGVTPWH